MSVNINVHPFTFLNMRVIAIIGWIGLCASGFIAFAILNPAKELTEADRQELRKKYGISETEYERRKKENDILMQRLKEVAGIKDEK